MSKEIKLWAIVPAAGNGTRFGAGIPKQYMDLDGLPVIQRSLQTLLEAALFVRVVVALADDDTRFSSLAIADNPQILKVIGGSSRAHSVYNALCELEKKAQPEDWVVVHDAARPLLQQYTLKHFVSSLRDEEVGGILASPVHDTLKQLAVAGEQNQSDKLTIDSTIDRGAVMSAQTPQMFRFGILFSALREALASEQTAASITDEASAVEQAGHSVKIIANDLPNIKITLQSDLDLAAFYLKTANHLTASAIEIAT